MEKTTFIVGLDGSETGARALAFAKDRAAAIGDCAIVICYVIEWSPFTFQTAEENRERHKRREAEIAMAHERVLNPAPQIAPRIYWPSAPMFHTPARNPNDSPIAISTNGAALINSCGR